MTDLIRRGGNQEHIQKTQQKQPTKKGSCSLSKVIFGVVSCAAIYFGARFGLGGMSQQPLNPSPPVDILRNVISPYRGYYPSAPFATSKDSFQPSDSCDFSLFAGSALSKAKEDRPNLRPQYKIRMMRPNVVELTDLGLGYQVRPEGVGNFREQHNYHLKTLYGALKQEGYHPIFQQWSENPIDKGYLLSVKNPITKITTDALISIDSLSEKDYSKAGKYTDKFLDEVLEKDLSDTDICKRILKTNQLLLGNPKNTGKFRRDDALVFSDNGEDFDRSPKALSSLMRKRGAGKNEVQIFLKNFQRVHAKGWSDKMRGVTNRYLAYVTPRFEEIPKLMRRYAQTLKAGLDQIKSCKNFDPVALAAWAHQDLVRIHPFEDANGRTARMIMNRILEKSGYPTVVFPSDAEYSAAVVKDGHEPGHFAKYLRNTAIPWVEKQFDANKPCLIMLDCEEGA